MFGKNTYTSCLLALLPLTALFSCSSNDPEPEVTIERDYSVLSAQTNNATGAVWGADDTLTVYTLASKEHYSYTLATGQGTANATFNRRPASSAFSANARSYALTAAHYIYGISVAEGDDMKLTYELPNEYDAEQLSHDNGSLLMNIPTWGELTFDAKGQPSATLKPLTAFLRVDLAQVPDNTQCILISTHSDYLLNDVATAGGSGEPLTGNFDCVLKEGATLETNSIFVYGDVIRIVLDEDWQELESLYVPIPVGRYERLQVLALSELFYLGYNWKGELLTTLEGQQFSLNAVK